MKLGFLNETQFYFHEGQSLGSARFVPGRILESSEPNPRRILNIYNFGKQIVTTLVTEFVKV